MNLVYISNKILPRHRTWQLGAWWRSYSWSLLRYSFNMWTSPSIIHMPIILLPLSNVHFRDLIWILTKARITKRSNSQSITRSYVPVDPEQFAFKSRSIMYTMICLLLNTEKWKPSWCSQFRYETSAGCTLHCTSYTPLSSRVRI